MAFKVPQSIGAWIQPKATTPKLPTTPSVPQVDFSGIDPTTFNPANNPSWNPGQTWTYGGTNVPIATSPTGAPYPIDQAAGGSYPGGANDPSNPGGHYQMPTQSEFEAMIQGDPTYMAEHAGALGDLGSAMRARQMSVQRAITQFGAAPQNWLQGGLDVGDIDQATLAAAAANPFSTLHQLSQGHDRAVADLQAALAGRGLLSSGALTGGLQARQTAYEQSQADQTQALLDALAGFGSTYASAQRSINLADAQARAEAAARQQALVGQGTWVTDPVTQTPTPTPTPPAASGGGYYTGPTIPDPLAGLDPNWLQPGDPWYGGVGPKPSRNILGRGAVIE